jgi:hypothetical protein
LGVSSADRFKDTKRLYVRRIDIQSTSSVLARKIAVSSAERDVGEGEAQRDAVLRLERALKDRDRARQVAGLVGSDSGLNVVPLIEGVELDRFCRSVERTLRHSDREKYLRSSGVH